MTFPLDHDIRFSEAEDLAFMERWFAPSHACDPYPFGPEEKEEALKNWIGFAKYKASLTATIDNVPCAIGTLFLMPYKKVAHHCPIYLIVDPDHRRKGLGFSMIRNLLHLARTRFRLESIYAEVFEPSALKPLLEKLEFKTFAHQENYEKVNGVPHARILLEHFF
jgi:RimJ/RimL family protein N-acetyltransferase